MSDADDGYYGPALPPGLARKEEPKEEAESSYGPALPPKLISPNDQHKMEESPQSSTTKRRIFGPTLPSEISQLQQQQDDEGDSSDDDTLFGPLPPDHKTAASLALEERALELKLSHLSDGSRRGDSPEQREEWMLKPPEIIAKIGIEKKTKFSHSKCERDRDQSAWTETPAEKKRKAEGHKSKSDQKKELQALSERVSAQKRDAEQERIANKLKKKHKRDKSLLELHSEKRKKDKGSKPADEPRRPFNRETDLQMNQLNSRQVKSVIDKAKILDSRFSSGSNKYL